MSWERASAEADDVVKPVTHKTESPGVASLYRLNPPTMKN
jgi:hypothetical protein